MISFRRLHLIDIENICGDARPAGDIVQVVRRWYLSRVRPNHSDLVVIACNHGAALTVGLAWPGVRLLVGSGLDGADRQLLDVIGHERVEDRFDGIVIASGDAIFTDAAAQLVSDGLRVYVASRGEALSTRLRLAAQTLIAVPSLDLMRGVA